MPATAPLASQRPSPQVVQVVVAGLAAYRLARTMGLGRPAAFVAGTTWPLSGTCLSHLTHFNILEAMALAPLGRAAATAHSTSRTWQAP